MSKDPEKNISPQESSDAYGSGSEHHLESNPVKRFINGFKIVDILDDDKDLTPEQRAIMATTKVPMKKALSNRHIQMIAIGGSIGAGFFIATGTGLVRGGPAGLLIGYFLIGILLFSTMTALGELGVRYPVNGVFSAYNSRFIDPSWGFAIGWNYTIGWFLSLPTELVAASVTIGYWKDDGTAAATVNKAAWVALFYGVVLFINLFGVRGYGEAEVVFSAIKVITIIGFIILGIILTCGGGPQHEYIGGRYWHDPGAFAHGAKGVFRVFVQGAYAFSGAEFAGLAAAETKFPHKAIPRATRQVFWRILIFYLVSIVLLGCLVPYTDKRLGTASNASASPFVIAIKNAGIHGLPSVFNVVILIATLSVGNAAIFGSTRTLVSLSAQGLAPRFFLKIDREGRPLAAMAVAFLVGLLGFIAASPKEGEVFTWLSSLGGLSSILTWGSICVCHLRNRIAMRQQGISLNELEYKSPFGIYGSIVGITMTVFVLGIQFWVALFPLGGDGASAETFFQSWLSACIILALYFAHKLFYRKLWVRTKDIDVTTGVRIADREQLQQMVAEDKARFAAKPWYAKLAEYVC